MRDVTCDTCHGAGTVPCGCDGDCDTCGETGEVWCDVCEGEGGFDAVWEDPDGWYE